MFRRWLDSSRLVRVPQIERVRSDKWGTPREQEMGHCSQTIKITGRPHNCVAARLLGAHVERRAERSAGLGNPRIRSARLRDQPKVQEFGGVGPAAEPAEHNVSRLHIPMDQSKSM